MYWSSSTFFEFITFTICYFYCPNEKISFLYFLLSDSIEINLSWRAPFYFLVWSRSCIIFWIWLTVSINFFSIPWYWLNLDSNFWNTSLRAWIYLIFSEIIPLIRSIYFVRFIYFCLWILISYWIWVNVNHKPISIQALYDYKFEGFNPEDEEGMLFQFKHCTIIRVRPESECITIPKFQFKHCTIIRKRRAMKAAQMEYFNSSIVRL